jgi:hypothetical protein
MVVQKQGMMGIKDRWELVSLDLASKKGGSTIISGKGFDVLGAETVSVSGIGISLV